jgi:hypothetical protein
MTGLSCAVQRAFISISFNELSSTSKQQKRTIMKIKMIVCSALATALLTGCININYEGHGKQCQKGEQQEKKGEKSEKGEAQNQKATQAKLMAEAKVSKETAQQTALTKVPNGAIKEGELEMEKGKLIWSFCFTIPDSKDIKEVNVDAVTGDVVGGVETETPEIQAKEAAGDAAKPKQEKKGEDKD